MSPEDIRLILALVLRSIKTYSFFGFILIFFPKKTHPLVSELALHSIIKVFQLCSRKSQIHTKSEAWN